MSNQPRLRVSKEAVEAARAEVAAYEAAGIGDKVDPVVRRIASAKPVPVAVQTSSSKPPKKAKGGASLLGRSATHRSVVSGRFVRNRAGEGQARRVDG